MIKNRVWWKDAVGYQIYLRSFHDSNGDGIGDIQGIIQKLDYLKNLGVNLLWICPFYPSPMDDNGYDIKDFYGVSEDYGRLEDIEQLLEEAHRREIKVIFDLVLNHASDEHPWFLEAISEKNHPKQEYFYFVEPKNIEDLRQGRSTTPVAPNTWKSFFCESAWTYVPSIEKYYLHIFSKKMPDLNWHNPLLREEMYQVARFWLEKGVDGFRLDAIAHLAKDQSLSESDAPLDEQGLRYDPSKFSNRPEIFEFLSEFKEKVLKHFPYAVTVGEVGGGATVEEGLRYAGYEQGSLNMVFNFDHCWENGAYGSLDKRDDEIKTNLVNLKRILKSWYEGTHEKAWQPIYWLNHDHPRLMNQYGNLKHPLASGTMLAGLLLFLYGTPFIYQGEEIGMTNVDYTRLEDFKDVNAQNFYHEHKHRYSYEHLMHILRRISRVNARSPFQWSAETPDLEMPVNKNKSWINVQNQENARHSLLKNYQRLIRLRKSLADCVLEGKIEWFFEEHPAIIALKKTYEDQELILLANFFEETCEIESFFEGTYNCLFKSSTEGIVIQDENIFMSDKAAQGFSNEEKIHYSEKIKLHPYEFVLFYKKNERN